MHRQLTSFQWMEVEAYARIDAVPETEIELEQKRIAHGRWLSEKAKAAFGAVFGKKSDGDRSNP